MTWTRALLLGSWLSVVAVWPAQVVSVGMTHLLWQPILWLSIAAFIVWRQRHVGWGCAGAQGFLIYLMINLAAWLPSLRTSHYWTEYPYPQVYGHYLTLYEGALAALVGAAACRTVIASGMSWWTVSGWSRPFLIAPLLLLVRGAQAGHWGSLLIGIACGAVVVLMRPWQWLAPLGRACASRPRWVVSIVFVVGALLVYGAALRMYVQTGAAYPSASDDGIHYHWMATAMAQDPALFFTPALRDIASFTGYYVVMACWFMIAGASMPLWLLWHGIAGGLLAVVVFWLGRRVAGTAGGLVAAGLVMTDRIILHLMGTMNMETFFIPMLYLGMVLWIIACERPPDQQWGASALAGLALGLATVFRSTSVLVPIVLIGLFYWCERPRLSRTQAMRQSGWMCLGFAVPMALMIVRHWIAWGYWTLGGERFGHGMRQNYALTIGGHNLVDMGVVLWLRLVGDEPSLIWRHIIPSWWEQMLRFWTHPGFGQMDLLHGLNHVGPYQAMLDTGLLASGLIGMGVAWRRGGRCEQTLLMLPVYFTALVLIFFVLNSRYRSPMIPALYLVCCLGGTAIVTALHGRGTRIGGTA